MQISLADFDERLSSFRRSAFHLESQGSYALSGEAADFARFLAGNPVPPPELDWWAPWLEQVARLTAAGRTVARIRILDDPPSSYQRWQLWAAPWHAAAGEDIRYLTRGTAAAIGLPAFACDWWLLDDDQLIFTEFTPAGELAGLDLVTRPGTVAAHRRWRQLARLYGGPAEAFAA